MNLFYIIHEKEFFRVFSWFGRYFTNKSRNRRTQGVSGGTNFENFSTQGQPWWCLLWVRCLYRYTKKTSEYVTASLVYKLYMSIRTMLDFWASLVLEFFLVAYFKRYILILGHFSDVFSGLQTGQVGSLYHNIFWIWTMFYLRVFSIDTHRKCKTKHYFF